MANIINNNFNNLKIKLNNDNYWDFFISKDNFTFINIDKNIDINGCLVSYIDSSDKNCIDNNWILGKSGYTWEYANNTKYTLSNIGYTGFDNGLFNLRRDRIMNSDFLKLYQETEYTNEDETDNRLKLHMVSGSTYQYEYPISIVDEKIKCNGGFYQGYFETTCEQYAILPSQIEEEWNLEFELNKTEFEKESNKTLNDKYPNNKGIFFYIGTRAENKWAYLYNKDNDECLFPSIDDYVEDGKYDDRDKINAFLDMHITFPKTYLEAEAYTLMDYISYKYYDNELYKTKGLEEDDFFIDDYISLSDKPKIIDKENNDYEDIIWGGCQIYTNKDECVDDDNKPIEEYISACGYHRQIPLNEEGLQYMKGWYSGKNFFDDVDDLDVFDNDDTDFIEDDIDISDFEYYTNDGFKLKLKGQYSFKTDNKFLLFNRTCTGFTIDNWEEGTIVEFQGRKTAFKGNLFLLMNRTCTGYNVSTIDELRDNTYEEYNIYKDLYNNALAFRITDKGEIGYKYYILDCESENKCKIIESYSKENIIKENEWYKINVKITKISSTLMKISFYINGKLKFISKEIPLLNLRSLHDIQEKQEGVAYNISLGGGSQGLIETVLPNYMLNPYRKYPIEENFAGTFIGYIRKFKFYNCPLNFSQIQYNFSKKN